MKSLAELQRSNEILKKAVSAFESAAHLGSKSDTTDATRIEGYVSAAESLAFLGLCNHRSKIIVLNQSVQIPFFILHIFASFFL